MPPRRRKEGRPKQIFLETGCLHLTMPSHRLDRGLRHCQFYGLSPLGGTHLPSRGWRAITCILDAKVASTPTEPLWEIRAVLRSISVDRPCMLRSGLTRQKESKAHGLMN